MANALKKSMTDMPVQLWRSLTWDRGKELSDHARYTVESGVKVFFADPHSPWQRGTNENTNGLLRQYFPKGTDLSRWSAREIQAVANALNTRPRKTLGWKTPAEALDGVIVRIVPNLAVLPCKAACSKAARPRGSCAADGFVSRWTISTFPNEAPESAQKGRLPLLAHGY